MSRSDALGSGVMSIEPEELKVSVKAGTQMTELASALAAHGQRLRIPMIGTVGGALAARRNGPFAADNRTLPNIVLMLKATDGLGRAFRAGGTTVKNVSGFDLVKVLVGSNGTLATITEALLRTEPVPQCSRWFLGSGSTGALYRPTLVVASDDKVLVNLEGHPVDVEEQRALIADFTEIDRPTDAELLGLAGSGPRLSPVDMPQLAVCRRLKAAFDPDNRLSPALSVELGLVS